jgi:hypothetical protein
MAWDPQRETYAEYLDRTGGGDESDLGPGPRVGDVYPGTNERIVGSIPSPDGTGYIFLGEKGGVFAPQGGFQGSYYSLDPSVRNDPNRRFTGIEGHDGGGYTLRTDNPDEHYDFAPPPPPPPTPNPIYSDPAIQAFLRTSGLGLDIYAADTERQVNNVNRVVNTQVGDLQFQQGEANRRVGQQHENRGMYRSGGRLRGQAVSDRTYNDKITDTQNQGAQQVGTLVSGLAGKVAETWGKAAEQGLDIGADQLYGTGDEDLRKKYPNAFAKAGS